MTHYVDYIADQKRDPAIVAHRGAWHGAPYPVHHDGTVLICLPERTYLRDTSKILLEEKDYMEITL